MDRRLNPGVTLQHWYSGTTSCREELTTTRGDLNKPHEVYGIHCQVTGKADWDTDFALAGDSCGGDIDSSFL